MRICTVLKNISTKKYVFQQIKLTGLLCVRWGGGGARYFVYKRKFTFIDVSLNRFEDS